MLESLFWYKAKLIAKSMYDFLTEATLNRVEGEINCIFELFSYEPK
jgi:hypothetical protein